MRVHVDREVCQNYGQCVFAAPAIFDLDDDGELVYVPEVSDGDRPDLEMAASACPVQAIEMP